MLTEQKGETINLLLTHFKRCTHQLFLTDHLKALSPFGRERKHNHFMLVTGFKAHIFSWFANIKH